MLSFFRNRGRAVSVAFASGLAMGVVGTGIAATSGAVRFPDVPAGSYFDQAVGVMADRGIIKGNPDGTFNPAGVATRADIAVMMHRLLISIGEEDATSTPTSRSSRSRETEEESSSSVATSSSSSSSSVGTSVNGTVRFATTTASIIENASIGGISVAIVRTGGAQGAISVNLTASDGTGKTGEDYQPLTTTLNFANNETSKTVKLNLIDDTASEGSETVMLTLSEVQGGALLGTPTQMTVTITDNEAPSSFAASSGASSTNSSAAAGAGKFMLGASAYGPAENAGTLTVTVQRVDGTTGTAAVNYSTSNGTAASGTDYSSTSGTLTFAAGETSKTFTVSIADNTTIDGNRNFNITLTNPTGGAALGIVPTAVATINDNETQTYGTGSLKLLKTQFPVTEASGEALITIQRVGGAKNRIQVSFATSNGTALASSDYTATSTTLTFEIGETGKLVRVPLLKDELADSDETINITLSSPTGGAQLIDPSIGTILIQ